MRAVFALVLVIGLGLAGFAVYMAQDFLSGMRTEVQRLQAEKARMPEMTQVVVADTEKGYGESIGPDDVKPILWQADSLPEGVFASVDEMFPDTQTRFVLRRIERHEPVLAVKVTEPGEDAGLTSRLPKGMRAFTLRVDVSSGVSGFLRPGDLVDVYWTGNGGPEGGSLGREITKLIDTNVRIIAVDQIADTERNSPLVARTVTVQVTPQQVAALAQAQSSGRLSLALVGAADDTVTEVVQVNQNDLLGIAERGPVVVEEQEEVCTTRVRRGADVITQQIPCTN